MTRWFAVPLIVVSTFILAGTGVAFPGDEYTSALEFIHAAREQGAVIYFFKSIEDSPVTMFGEHPGSYGKGHERYRALFWQKPEEEIRVVDTGILFSRPGDRGSGKKGTGTIFIPNEAFHIARALYLYPKDEGEPLMVELYVWLK